MVFRPQYNGQRPSSWTDKKRQHVHAPSKLHQSSEKTLTREEIKSLLACPSRFSHLLSSWATQKWIRGKQTVATISRLSWHGLLLILPLQFYLIKIQCFWILPFDLELINIKLDKHLTFPHLTLTVDYIYKAGHCQERNDDSFLIYLSGPIPWAHQQDIRPHNKDNTVTEEKSV